MSNSHQEGGDKPGEPPGHLTIYFVEPSGNEVPKSVHPGQWQIRALKELFGVDPSKVLAEISPTAGLQDLPDDGHLAVQAGQKFMAHVREGAAS